MTDPASPSQSRLPQWVRAELTHRQVWQLAGALFLAVTAIFGGLETVTPPVRQLAVGEPFSDGEFTVTVKKLSRPEEVTGARRVMFPAVPGYRYLAVLAAVRCDGTVDGNLINDGVGRPELNLRDVREQEFLGAFRARDGSPITRLGPGLTEDVVFLWKVPEAELPPDTTVTLRVWDKEFHEGTVVYGKLWNTLTSYAELSSQVQTP